MMTSKYPLDEPIYCPSCGYDLRSLPVDGVCPECGQPTRFGVWVEQINRWAERRALDLYCIAVLLVVVGLAVLVASSGGGAWAGVLVCPLPICLGAAIVWYMVTSLRWLWQRRRPNYRNVAAIRRRHLVMWLLIDGVLLVMVTGLVALWLAPVG